MQATEVEPARPFQDSQRRLPISKERKTSITHRKPETAPDFDAQRIAAELKKEIQGEVRFDDGSRALYAADLSIYRHVPGGVVIPRAYGRLRERRRA